MHLHIGGVFKEVSAKLGISIFQMRLKRSAQYYYGRMFEKILKKWWALAKVFHEIIDIG